MRITGYACEKCGREFQFEYDCKRHEEHCGVKHKFTCDKCGKSIEYSPDIYSDSYFEMEGCHTINLGRPGYGSGLDGCDVCFDLCDDCLIELINSFTIEGQEKVYNSGSNTFLSSEDWIRVHKGEMPDEEMEEKHMYSPRQIKAYQERFPVCDKVNIVEYSDGSKGSRCPFGAFGESDGNYGRNISSECFQCEQFKERNGEIKVIHDSNY